MSKPTGRSRKPKNTVTTRSGKTLKINHSLSDRSKARKTARETAKAAYLSTLPKDRLKRLVYRMHPKRVAAYWFSREGGIMALKIVGVCIVLTFFLSVGMFAYFRKDLPKIKDIGGTDLGGSNTYYDRTGQTVLWQDYSAIKRVAVPGDQISPYLKQATVAIEDKDFYKHGAFDVRGIMRAAYNDAKGGGGGAVQGGSTITQQLVKLNENWTDNRTITRKVKELILATELEREYSKNDILTGYLNIAPYGGVDYGAESAARDYFQVGAKDLTLAQASLLAAIPQSPSYYSPYASSKYNSAVTSDSFSPSATLGRQHYILDQMAKQGFITAKQASDAKKVDVLAQIHPQESRYKDIKAPYFVLAAKQELQQKYGSTTVLRGGWKITTTVDMNLQNKAESLVASNLPHVKSLTHGAADDEAVVTEDVQTGQIVALVGGTDFNNTEYGKINFAATAKVSPGSTFKPYDYATLIDNNNNVGAGSVLYDNQVALPGYPCTVKRVSSTQPGNCLTDYDFLNPGAIPLRYALGGSRNVPAVKAMYEAIPNDKSADKKDSVNKVIGTASALMDNTYTQSHNQKSYNCYAPGTDISVATADDVTQCGGASAIGDGLLLLDDQVNGLSSLARLGKAIPRTYILKITDSSLKTVYQWKQPVGKQVIKADSAYIVDDMASDPNASYLPPAYKFHRYQGWNFAIKTGTNNSGFEGLMASWSNKYATISWVANHTRNVDIGKTTSMEYLTEPLTRGMMEAAHDGVKADNWVKPTTVKTGPAFVLRNHIHYGDVEPSPTNDLFPGWYAGGTTTNGKSTSAVNDKVSGKTATSCTPAAAKETVYNGNSASWNIDIFAGGKPSTGSTATTSKTSTATDDVHNCNDSPPTVTLTAPSDCNTSCTVTATVTQGTHPLSDSQYAQFPGTVTFTLGGQQIHTENVSDSPSTISFTYTPSSSGSDTLTATVTDSVLYSGTTSQQMNYKAAPTVAALTNFTAQVNGNIVAFSWSGGSGNYSVYRSDNNVPLCPAPSGNSCQSTKTAAPSGTSVTLKDTQTQQTLSVNVQ